MVPQHYSLLFFGLSHGGNNCYCTCRRSNELVRTIRVSYSGKFVDCSRCRVHRSIFTERALTNFIAAKKRSTCWRSEERRVEVPSTPPRVQNDAPYPLGGEKDPAPIGPKSQRQVNLSKLSSLESNFDEGYDSDGERGPWCDVIGLEGRQDYDEDEIPEIQVKGVTKEEDVNVI